MTADDGFVVEATDGGGNRDHFGHCQANFFSLAEWPVFKLAR